MEDKVHSHLMKFLENNKILRDFQHDLRKRTSCETQLITSIHDLSVDLDRWKQVGTILLDFSKAFDIALHCSRGGSKIYVKIQ